MDPLSQITVSQESSILAYGKSPRSRFFPLLYLIAAMVVVGVVLIIGLTAFFRPLPLPLDTVVMVSVRPKTAATLLSDDDRARLPILWQRVIETHSAWPVVLGVAKNADGWQPFALIPRWSAAAAGSNRINAGFISLIQNQPLIPSSQNIRYSDPWSWRKGHRSSALAFWVNPAPLVPNKADGWLPFTAAYDQNALWTNVPYEQTSGDQTPLKDGDIAMRLNSVTQNVPVQNALLDAITLGDMTLAKFPTPPQEISLAFDASATLADTYVRFAAPIGREQANMILSAFNIVARRSVRLPSGEMMVETVPWLKENDTVPTSTETTAGTLRIQDAELEITHTADTSTQPGSMPQIDRTCAGHPVDATFSGRILERIATQYGLLSLPSLPRIDISSNRNQMVVCFQ